MHDDLIQLYQTVIRRDWEHLALTDIGGESLQYKDMARRVAKLHLLFEHTAIRPGDRIALCGKNSSAWAVTFIAVLTYGAVAVPLLHEFKPDTIHHLVGHSDSRLLFVDDTIYATLSPDAMPHLEGVILMQDYEVALSRNPRLTKTRDHLNEYFGKRYPSRFTPDDVVYRSPADPTALCLINYTSGSTGFSKGVMLSYEAIWSNIRFCLDNLKYPAPGQSMVCMLPMAHMYGLVIETLHGLAKGAHLYFLTRVPSPKVLLEAFAIARPELIITVPLIIEKIVRTQVFPRLRRPAMRALLHTPFARQAILKG
ncbi:MAG: AMP-binding protein, partial [Muribaculaceae bacterium]|nr:AMP-binding protein [Muribaculaceae bacterium]